MQLALRSLPRGHRSVLSNDFQNRAKNLNEKCITVSAAQFRQTATSKRIEMSTPRFLTCRMTSSLNLIHDKYVKSLKNVSERLRKNSANSLANSIVEKAPVSLQPYLKLMRIDKPTGTWLVLWPCYWSIGLAADPCHLPSLYHIVLFGLGAVVMRGAGCTVNDMWDKDLDKKVERTKSRPLSSGQLDRSDALAFLAAQLTVADLILWQLNWYSLILGTCAVFPVVLYPIAKRFTYWPQLVLGVTFNWGIMIGWAAVHGFCYWPVVLPLYLAAISWTLFYDTIYAHQDKIDDASVGIKSTALKFGAKTKTWLSIFSTSMIGNLLIVGAASGQSLPYYASVGIVAVHLCRQLWKLDINNNKDCLEKFQSNTNIGIILFAGIVCGNLLK